MSVTPRSDKGQEPARPVDDSGEDAMFLACPRCNGMEFAVICDFIAGKPFISELLCSACGEDSQIAVEGGSLAGQSLGWVQ